MFVPRAPDGRGSEKFHARPPAHGGARGAVSVVSHPYVLCGLKVVDGRPSEVLPDLDFGHVPLWVVIAANPFLAGAGLWNPSRCWAALCAVWTRHPARPGPVVGAACQGGERADSERSWRTDPAGASPPPGEDIPFKDPGRRRAAPCVRQRSAVRGGRRLAFARPPPARCSGWGWECMAWPPRALHPPGRSRSGLLFWS